MNYTKFLLIVLGLTSPFISFSCAVHSALYAKIDLKDRSLLLYRGAYQELPIPVTYKIKARFARPTVTFFNEQDQQILCEVILDGQLNSIDELIATTQERLTVMPEVCAVDVVNWIEPSHLSVEMYDSKGHCIVNIFFSVFQDKNIIQNYKRRRGYPLSEVIIEQCAPFISNPESLTTLPVRNVHVRNYKVWIGMQQKGLLGFIKRVME